MIDKKIATIISLLDDDDPEVVEIITNQLCDRGEQIIPALQSAWLSSQNELHAQRINHVIRTIAKFTAKQELYKWVKSGAEDMLNGALSVCKLFEPNIALDRVINDFEKIISSIWLELHDKLTALEKVSIINQILFKKCKFTTTISGINEPNLLLSKALLSRNGAHITMSIIYVSIAQRINLPINGVAHPQSTLLVYHQPPKKNAFFFIDPLQGIILGKEKLISIIAEIQKTQDLRDTSFTPCNNATLLYRYVYLIREFYKNTKNTNKIDIANEVLKILANKI
ncbi:MAG: transglutaminase family protein [Bacteroidales bacterium]